MDSIPQKVLGLKIKTKWQIFLNFFIPCTMELLVYISVMVTDSCLIYQHFIDKNNLYAWITIGLIIIPAVLMTLITIISPERIISETQCSIHLIRTQALYLLLFPIFATYRFSRKIFWCIESFFHDKNSYGRHAAISKAAESSQFELYHFLQSFFHCAPQIVFQLYIILRNDMFRNYDTAFVQAISIIFCITKMSMSAESYQRFESKKIVGKSYPWHLNSKLKAMRSVSESDIYFKERSLKFHNFSMHYFNIKDNNKKENLPKEIFSDQSVISHNLNITDDQKINLFSINNVNESKGNLDHERTLDRFSDMKKSILFSFTKEKNPRVLNNACKSVEENINIHNCELPKRHSVSFGIDEDDIIAKFIAFLGWNFFLIMRILALSSFSVFYLNISGYICLVHYFLMLLSLINETGFKTKRQRLIFYFVLSYIYIFNLIEFKVKFNQVRTWYVVYFFFVFSQNVAMTLTWYYSENFSSIWWFEYIFLVVMQSGIISLMCFLLYFFYLKPKDRLLQNQ